MITDFSKNSTKSIDHKKPKNKFTVIIIIFFKTIFLFIVFRQPILLI